MKINRLISIVLCLLSGLALMAVPAGAADNTPAHSMDDAYYSADRLYSLGLFKGAGVLSDGTPDYQLERPATRVEALVMLLRLMGREAEALSGRWAHPFADVEKSCPWGSPYVGYAYAKGLTVGSGTDGQGNPVFGLGDATAEQYLTFVLRAMGYTDGDTSPTLYEEAISLSRRTGVLNAEDDTTTSYINLEKFCRAEVALVSWRAMYADTKEGDSLYRRLIKDGVFTEEGFESANSLRPRDHSTVAPLRLSTGPRSFSFTIVNMDRMSKLWLSDGSYVGDDWMNTDKGWVECNVQQNPLTAVLTVWTDIDFEHITLLKVRYTKTEGTNTALFGSPIRNGGRYWMDEESNNNGGLLMTERP